MPIYEFYCEKCNTIYKFLSRAVNTEKIPECPKFRDHRLKRKMSLFSAVLSRKEAGAGDETLPIDEAKMERAMSMLQREAEGINEDDPRQAATLIRKLSDATGLKMGSCMEEALNRLERGEDPEKIEQEMGTILNGEDPFTVEGPGKRVSRKTEPEVDETLYDF